MLCCQASLTACATVHGVPAIVVKAAATAAYHQIWKKVKVLLSQCSGMLCWAVPSQLSAQHLPDVPIPSFLPPPSFCLASRERDAYEATCQAKDMQVQLAEESVAAAEARAAELATALAHLERAHSEAQADLQQQATEMEGLTAEATRRAADQEAAAAAAAERAAALARAERELGVLRAQLEARSADAKSSKQRRWAGPGEGGLGSVSRAVGRQGMHEQRLWILSTGTICAASADGTSIAPAWHSPANTSIFPLCFNQQCRGPR